MRFLQSLSLLLFPPFGRSLIFRLRERFHIVFLPGLIQFVFVMNASGDQHFISGHVLRAAFRPRPVLQPAERMHGHHPLYVPAGERGRVLSLLVFQKKPRIQAARKFPLTDALYGRSALPEQLRQISRPESLSAGKDNIRARQKKHGPQNPVPNS